MIKIATTDEERGFNLNQVGDYILVNNASACMARIQISPIGNSDFGDAEVALLGSLDLSDSRDSAFFEVDQFARMTKYGISRRINVTGIPALRVQVVVPHGTASSPAKVSLSYV